MSDVDLLFASVADRLRATEIILDEGYAVREPVSGRTVDLLSEHHHSAPLTSSLTGLTIELHTNLCTPALPKAWIGEICASAIQLVALPRLAVLEPVAALVHHALHALANPVDSPLLRNLFEVGWLAAHLRTAQVEQLRHVLARLDVADAVGRVLGLAHVLFGAPALVEVPRWGALELWCLARLEWSQAPEVAPSAWRRLRAGVALGHVRAVGRGQGDRSVTPLLRVLAEIAGGGLAGRMSRLFRSRRRQLCPGRIEVARLRWGVLVHAQTTGRAHALDAITGAALLEAEAGRSAGALTAFLEEAGVDPRRTELVVDQLQTLELLVPEDG